MEREEGEGRGQGLKWRVGRGAMVRAEIERGGKKGKRIEEERKVKERGRGRKKGKRDKALRH